MQLALVAVLLNPAPVVAPLPTSEVKLGGVIAFTAEYFPEEEAGTNGFYLANARLNLKARVLEDTEFFIQTELIKSPALLDARVSWLVAQKAAVLDFGLFKAPNSAEFLLPIQDVDFTNRYQGFTRLGIGRRGGVMLRGKVAEGQFNYKLGVFNGAGLATEDGRVSVVGRAETTQKVGSGTLTAALNGGWAKDDPFGLIPAFVGNRVLAGGDFRLTLGNFGFWGEGLFTSISPDGAESGSAFGYHASASYTLVGTWYIQGRWESLKADDFGQEQDFVVFGTGFATNDIFTLYWDAYIPPDEPGHVGVFFTAQADW